MWTPPTARSTGELITASIWNTDLRDNLFTLKTSVLDNGHLYDSVIRSITALTTVVDTDDVIIATANSFTVTLLTAVGRAGRRYTIKNTGTGTITLGSTAGETVDGLAASAWTLLQGDALTCESDNANWVLV